MSIVENLMPSEQKINPTNENQGEGDKEAAQRYNESQHNFVRSGKVEKAEKARDDFDGCDKNKLTDAEREGASRRKVQQRRMLRQPCTRCKLVIVIKL
jgi:hypothetical protein